MASFTKTFHRKSYKEISPLSPANSQAGRTVLITGSSVGIGYAIAQSFVKANAKAVILTGRRRSSLDDAASKLVAARPAGSQTQVIAQQLDVASVDSIKNLWKTLAGSKVSVDVLVLNAAATGPAGILANGSAAFWEHASVDILANLQLSEEFLAQGPKTGKNILYITSSFASAQVPPPLRAYSASKAAATAAFQNLADETPVTDVQIVSYHPGAIYTEAAEKAGFTPDSIPWDDAELPGDFAVWASTPQAAFLHGRMVWANWDVTELKAKPEFDNQLGFLQIGLMGVEKLNPEKFFAEVAALGGKS